MCPEGHRQRGARDFRERRLRRVKAETPNRRPRLHWEEQQWLVPSANDPEVAPARTCGVRREEPIPLSGHVSHSTESGEYERDMQAFARGRNATISEASQSQSTDSRRTDSSSS